MKRHFPIKVLFSIKDEIEFPADWTNDTNHREVALIHNFTTTLTAYNNAEWEELKENLGYAYVSDIEEATLLFDDKETWERFKRLVPHRQGKARMITNKDREEYKL